jgi:ectoine hydroxylase-related dioxygenase (phytanoyl-CoA dioxygenase family)
MDPGDVLFFNGSVIHGSLPNRSDRFRRAFISHYIGASAPQVARFYQPLLNARGQIVDRPIAVCGGACGEDYHYFSNQTLAERGHK